MLNGTQFVVSSGNSKNSVTWLDNQTTDWRGIQITCACACENQVVCATGEGIIYVVSEDKIKQIDFDNLGLAINGIAPICDTKVIAGGERGLLVEVDTSKNIANVFKAKAFGAPKPGRDILNIIPYCDGFAAVGKKELVYIFEQFPGDLRSVEPVDKDVFFFNGCGFEGKLWLSGIKANHAVVAECDIDSNRISYFEPPEDSTGRAYSINCIGSNLLLANQDLFIGRNGNWKKTRGFAGPECIAIIPNTQDRNVTLVSYLGSIVVVEHESF